MKLRVLLLLSALSLAGCSTRLSTDSAAYGGIWESNDRSVELSIFGNGTVNYSRRLANRPVGLGGHLLGIDERGIVFRIFIVPVRIKVDEKPHLKDGASYMRIDGVEVKRIAPTRDRLGPSFKEFWSILGEIFKKRAA